MDFEGNLAVVDFCLEKILEDNPRTPIATTSSWALNTKTFLQVWCGFSSNQLAYNTNSYIPSVMIDNPLALEGITIIHQLQDTSIPFILTFMLNHLRKFI